MWKVVRALFVSMICIGPVTLVEPAEWRAEGDDRDSARVDTETVNPELLHMYEEDQSDRSGRLDWTQVGPRDEQRRRRVRELLESGAVRSADDHYHAAMILQHGSTPEDYKLAHELSLEAMELQADHDAARWLAAASKDRYLHSIGQPQIYGTQLRKIDGHWTLQPIDEAAVTDEERGRWGVPPLSEAKQREARMNGRD